jgi:alkyl hydroperoxide reductase subunit AhpC
MIELGQLERRHEDFAQRNTRVIVVSLEGLDDAGKTQLDFQHLLVLADHGRGLSDAAEIVHPHAGRFSWHEDADYPTTILVDRQGTVRWLIRPSVIARLSPDEVLEAIDQHIPRARQGGPPD